MLTDEKLLYLLCLEAMTLPTVLRENIKILIHRYEDAKATIKELSRVEVPNCDVCNAKAEAYSEVIELLKGKAEAYTCVTPPDWKPTTTYKITEKDLDKLLLKLTERKDDEGK